MSELNAEQIIKALEHCIKDSTCEQCPQSPFTCHIQEDAFAIIKSQEQRIKELTEENDKLKMVNHLLEQDVADRDEMLEKKVEEVYAEFMRDYKCMKEELEGYEELIQQSKADTRASTVRKMRDRVKQAICDNTYPDFDRNGKAVNIWNAVNGYDLIDQIANELLEVNDET